MITFYPKNIEMWQDTFYFGSPFSTQTKTRESFNSRNSFFEFFKKHNLIKSLEFDPITYVDFEEIDMVSYKLNCIGWVKWNGKDLIC